MADFNLGTVTAYGYARDKGYTGTEAEFAELMASYAQVAEDAAESAEQAAQSASTAATKASEASASATDAVNANTAAQAAKTGAETAAQTATTKADEASGSATTASTKATEAATSATSAAQSATTATTKAGEAATSATNAAASATSAAGSAQTAQDVADSIPADYTQLSEDVNTLKEDSGEYSLSVGYVNVAPQIQYLGDITINNAYRTITLNVIDGEKISIKGTGGAGAARLWATADVNKKIIRRAEASASGEFVITIESGEAYFVYNASYSGSFYCKQEGVVTLIGKAIEEINSNKNSISVNAEEIETNNKKIKAVNDSISSGKIACISAPSMSTSTTNYIAVVVPASVFSNSGGNSLSWDCFCDDDVTVYQALYNVDLSQSGNSRITTKLIGASNVSTNENGWYKYSNLSLANISPTGDYVALLFNVVPTDGVKRIIKAYFRNIVANGVLIDKDIKEVFLYSASITGSEFVNLFDANIISIIDNASDIIGDGKILCIGDSLTAGVYASDEIVHSENYPFYMKQLVSNDVVNKGEPGYSARMYWNNNKPQAIDFTGVKHIIIMLGTNGGLTDTLDADVLAHTDYTDYADTQTGCYCKIIEYCMTQAPTAQIYLCTTPFHNHDLQPNFDPPYTPDANIVIPKIAELYHFSMIDVRNGMGINQKNTLRFQSDGLHGDSEFYQKLGTFIGSQLRAKASYIM